MRAVIRRLTQAGRRAWGQLAVASGKRDSDSVMASMPGEKVVRTESCL